MTPKMGVFSRYRKIATRLSGPLASKARFRRFDSTAYWEDRAAAYQHNAVLNLQGRNADFNSVTETQWARYDTVLAENVPSQTGLVLDYGCGSGRFSPLLLKYGANVFGVDISRTLLSLAVPRDGVRYQLIRPNRLPYPDDHFDVVFISLVLGGITDAMDLLATAAELERVLKPNGFLLLTENTTSGEGVEHWRFRSVQEYQSLFANVALSISSVYQDSGEDITIMAGRKSLGSKVQESKVAAGHHNLPAWRSGIIGRQGRHLFNLLRLRPVSSPSLESATLELDDVDVSRGVLLDREIWYDETRVVEFQDKFARWNGSAQAYAFMGGRVALNACIYALELKPGDDVIIPGYTCIVVPNAFSYAGVNVICADIETDTYGLDVDAVARAITPNTRAVMLHHLYGLVCRDYEKLIDLCRSRGLFVIEDCAHSTGADWKGRKVGNLGDVGFFSSEHTKAFNTVQGGMAVTNDEAFGARMARFAAEAPVPDPTWIERQLKTGIYNYYKFRHPHRWFTGEIAELLYSRDLLVSTTEAEERGVRPAHYGRRMPGAIAQLGINQLGKIDRFNAIRRENAVRWDSWCDSWGFQKPLAIPESTPVYLRYPVMVTPKMKSDLGWASSELHVAPGLWFTSNYHPVPVSVPNCPNADRAVERCINFPTILS